MKTGSLIGEYIRICVPVLISDGILAIGNNTVAMVIGHLGKTFVAANAITAVTQQLSTVVVQGVSQSEMCLDVGGINLDKLLVINLRQIIVLLLVVTISPEIEGSEVTLIKTKDVTILRDGIVPLLKVNIPLCLF